MPLEQVVGGGGFTREQILERAQALLSGRTPIYELMRAEERARGYTTVLPGLMSWLPMDDWHESVVVSQDGAEVRLVAILAKRTGSFRRLVAALKEQGLTPVVVCPIGPIMPAILKHYGWTQRTLGSGWDIEEQWRPQ